MWQGDKDLARAEPPRLRVDQPPGSDGSRAPYRLTLLRLAMRLQASPTDRGTPLDAIGSSLAPQAATTRR